MEGEDMGAPNCGSSVTKPAHGISVEVKVDTTQLDEAIAKANQLVQLLERADVLAYRINVGALSRARVPTSEEMRKIARDVAIGE